MREFIRKQALYFHCVCGESNSQFLELRDGANLYSRGDYPLFRYLNKNVILL